mgnify:CR=1 FL=1
MDHVRKDVTTANHHGEPSEKCANATTGSPRASRGVVFGIEQLEDVAAGVIDQLIAIIAEHAGGALIVAETCDDPSLFSK